MLPSHISEKPSQSIFDSRIFGSSQDVRKEINRFEKKPKKKRFSVSEVGNRQINVFAS
jgi:hypothetical protein